jgi:hypothetical protein
MGELADVVVTVAETSSVSSRCAVPRGASAEDAGAPPRLCWRVADPFGGVTVLSNSAALSTIGIVPAILRLLCGCRRLCDDRLRPHPPPLPDPPVERVAGAGRRTSTALVPPALPTQVLLVLRAEAWLWTRLMTFTHTVFVAAGLLCCRRTCSPVDGGEALLRGPVLYWEAKSDEASESLRLEVAALSWVYPGSGCVDPELVRVDSSGDIPVIAENDGANPLLELSKL